MHRRRKLLDTGGGLAADVLSIKLYMLLTVCICMCRLGIIMYIKGVWFESGPQVPP